MYCGLHAAQKEALHVRVAVADLVDLIVEVDAIGEYRGVGYRRAGFFDE